MIETPAPAISLEEYHAALRGDFHTFMRRCFAELNSGAPFLSNWHLELVGAKLQAHESPHFVKDSCWPYFAAKS